MELTATKMKFETPDWIVHEVDFKDNQDKLISILRANLNNETIKVQVKVNDRVYEIMSNNLYF